MHLLWRTPSCIRYPSGHEVPGIWSVHCIRYPTLHEVSQGVWINPKVWEVQLGTPRAWSIPNDLSHILTFRSNLKRRPPTFHPLQKFIQLTTRQSLPMFATSRNNPHRQLLLLYINGPVNFKLSNTMDEPSIITRQFLLFPAITGDVTHTIYVIPYTYTAVCTQERSTTVPHGAKKYSRCE